MPRYIIERTTGTLTPEQLRAAAEKSIEVLDTLSDVEWVRSYVSDSQGKIYCEYDAPDEAAIRRHAELAGLPVDAISTVTREIGPALYA